MSKEEQREALDEVVEDIYAATSRGPMEAIM